MDDRILHMMGFHLLWTIAYRDKTCTKAVKSNCNLQNLLSHDITLMYTKRARANQALRTIHFRRLSDSFTVMNQLLMSKPVIMLYGIRGVCQMNHRTSMCQHHCQRWG